MMNQNNNLDDIDKMLFSYFDNNKEIPSSTQDTILNAFEKPRKTISLVYKIQKVAIVLISFIILTTGVVFAKDIINFITSLFTNTTEGINKAIENGYVQNIDMDFVYDNDIGIKVDYLVMDDTNLDVSFVYDYKGNEKVESIGILEYIIKDENNNFIYYSFEDESKMKKGECIATHYIRTNEQAYCRESILYQSNNFPNSKNLIFEIISIDLNKNIKRGNWIFNINLKNKMLERKNVTFTASYNQFIENISIDLTETCLKLDINFNTELDDDILLEPHNIILKNFREKEYQYSSLKSGNYSETKSNYKSRIVLEFDQISKFSNSDENLNLYLKINKDTIIEITLFK